MLCRKPCHAPPDQGINCPWNTELLCPRNSWPLLLPKLTPQTVHWPPKPLFMSMCFAPKSRCLISKSKLYVVALVQPQLSQHHLSEILPSWFCSFSLITLTWTHSPAKFIYNQLAQPTQCTLTQHLLYVLQVRINHICLWIPVDLCWPLFDGTYQLISLIYQYWIVPLGRNNLHSSQEKNLTLSKRWN